MYPRGDIYTSDMIHVQHVEVSLHAPRRVKIAYGFLRGFGAGLIGFALVSLFFTFGPVLKAELRYATSTHKDIPDSKFEELLKTAEADRISRVQANAQMYGVDSHFSVVIPKIEAASKVIANVDPGSEEEYLNALQNGIAHAAGTNFPGQDKRIYLFAHSTNSPANLARYNAVFYLLRKLEEGDQVIVFFADKEYVYEVKEKLVVAPDDTRWLESETNKEQLILQTCDPPGTTWRRLLVVAEPV